MVEMMICEYCKKEFKPKRRKQKCCNSKCGSLNWRCNNREAYLSYHRAYHVNITKPKKESTND